jgi:hypothetical protein
MRVLSGRVHFGGIGARLATTTCLLRLYHASWIDSLRDTTFGGLVLGFEFVWSDLVCYTVGIVFGAIIDRVAGPRAQRREEA